MKHLPVGQLVSDVIGGGWGDEDQTDGTTEVRVIRGADFPDVIIQHGSSLPTRYEEPKRAANRLLQPGDIVLEVSGGTKDRPTGRVVLVTQKLMDSAGSDLIPASFCRRLRPRLDVADSRYLYFSLLNWWNQGGAWEYQLQSTGIANFQFKVFSDKHLVRLPDLGMQRAIGEVLGALDDKIAANRRVQRSIDDVLDASFRKASRSAAECVELGSLIALNYGKSLPSSKRVEGPFPVVGSGGVVGYHVEPLVDGPAVIVGRKGSVGSTYWISEGCFPIDTTYWVAPKGVSLGYSYRLLQDIDFVAMNTDSAVPGLNRERAYALQVPLPNEEQLEEFDQLSEALTLKHSALEKEIAALARTRDELLPLLMNGRITIKDAEHAVEGVL